MHIDNHFGSRVTLGPIALKTKKSGMVMNVYNVERFRFT